MTDTASLWRQWIGRALAELAIVVLGVTLALWADDWVADRNDRDIEQARLHALRDNIDETLEDVRRIQAESDDAIAELRSLIDIAVAADDERREQIRTGLLYVPMFTPELNVYDDLKNSGELALLTSAELRRSLARMDSSMEYIRLALADIATVQQLLFDTFAVDHPVLGVFFDNPARIEAEVDTEAMNSLVEDFRFKNRIRHKRDLLVLTQGLFMSSQSALEDVYRLIEAELSAR